MLNRDDKRKESEWKARGNPVEKGFISFSFQLFSLSCLCYSVRLLCCVVCCNTSRNTIGVVLGWVFLLLKEKKRGDGSESRGRVRLSVQGCTDRWFWCWKIQSPVPIHSQRVLPRIQVHHWSRIRYSHSSGLSFLPDLIKRCLEFYFDFLPLARIIVLT